MRKILMGLFAFAVAALTLTFARPAMANEFPAWDMKTVTAPGPSFETCSNLKGWYANEDEQSDLPTATEAGLLFENKDLIHHAVSPIDFTDFDKTNKSFVATKPGKVVFKAETSGPYSTIVINADGKLWSTAFQYDAEGGQGHPVDKAESLINKPDSMKPGKVPYTAASRVETIGTGYWVAEGDTVVTSISFHGTKYTLTCTPPVVKPTATKSTSHPTTRPKPSASKSSSHTAGAPAAVGGGTSGGALAITGSSTWPMLGFGAAALAVGGGLFLLTRKRRAKFVA